MAVTAKRENMRLLAIVLGEDDSKVRNNETSQLLDYGFNSYKINMIKSKDDVIDKIHFEKADTDEIEITTKEDISILLKKNDQAKKYQTELKINDIKLPIKKGSVVGKLIIKDNGVDILTVDVISRDNAKKKNILRLYLDILKEIVAG